jgi:CubicO group peptidase (beta-lactamase class C family)
MKGPLELLRLLGPTIEKICESSGTPALSLGVLHHGDILFRDNFGFRDIETGIKPDSDTIYGVASLTKAFTSSLFGIMVEEGKISWDTPLHETLPGFHRDDEINQATMVDVLSQCTGMARSNQYWFGNDNGLLLDKDQIVPIVDYLRQVDPFRSVGSMNNWHFALAGEAIEELSGKSWGTTVKERLLNPLNLTRTIFWNDNEGAYDNVAKPYVALDDASPYCIPWPKLADGKIMSSAMGLRSSVNDLLIWSQALLKGLVDQRESGRSSTPGLPLKHLTSIMSGHCQLMSSYPGELGMGFMMTTLPNPIGAGGANPALLEKMPNVGSDSPGTEVLYYQGSMAGYTTSLVLVPESQSAVVVLANSMALNDAADWVSQAVLEAVLETSNPADYQLLSQQTAAAQISKFPALNKTLESKRIPGTHPKLLHSYTGRYYNSIRNFFLDVYVNDEEKLLHFSFQGLRDHQSWPLKHYHYDTFSWLMSRNECVKRARFAVATEGLYLFKFIPAQDETDNDIIALEWAHEGGNTQAETFVKLVHNVNVWNQLPNVDSKQIPLNI